VALKWRQVRFAFSIVGEAMISQDTKKDTAVKILNEELNIFPHVVKRFTNGYCHSVYYVETEKEKYVLRVSGSEWHYRGSLKWLPLLNSIGVAVPQILRNGQYGEVFYTLITYINGKDLGEIYHTLNDLQKREVARELAAIQDKVATLPIKPKEIYVYPSMEHENKIASCRERIKQNKLFDVGICDRVAEIFKVHEDYFINIQPVAFLDDISTKNVLVHEGKLAGIVDIDEMGYGDPLSVIGLTNMALLAMEADTKYIDYWLDAMNADEIQRKAVALYTLLFCIDFMSEKGVRYDNDNIVPVNQKDIELLTSIYYELITVI
jgi:aminoglycoside phosphotransferase (APT) family kinase protein